METWLCVCVYINEPWMCSPGLVSVWGSSVSRSTQLVSALHCYCSNWTPCHAEGSLQTHRVSIHSWLHSDRVHKVTASCCTCWGLDASLALSLRLDDTKASLHVALEELGGVFQERLQVSIRVLLFVLIQLRQTLRRRADTLLKHYLTFSQLVVYTLCFQLTSFVFSLEPIFLKISERMSLTLAFDIRSSWGEKSEKQKNPTSQMGRRILFCSDMLLT